MTKQAVMVRRGLAQGGLAAAAQKTASAGRNGDDQLVHVNAHELELMRKQWGEPTVNPETGMPEFFLGLDSNNGLLSALLPVAVNAFLPGVGGAIGGAIGGATGLFEAGSTAANAVGSGLVGAGVGALTGGGKGALIGGLAGAATPTIMGGLGSLTGGLFGGATGTGDTTPSNPRGGMTDAAQGNAVAGDKSTSSPGFLGGLFGSGSGSTLAKAAPLLLIGAAMASGASRQKAGPAPAQTGYQDQNQQQHLSQVHFGRTKNAFADGGDVEDRDEGLRDEHRRRSRVEDLRPSKPGTGHSPLPSWFDYVPSYLDRYQRTDGLAQGGQPQPGGLGAMSQAMPDGEVRPGRGTPHYVKGPGDGTSDDIPAQLANDEYVIDAQTVSMLGNGSSEAGAKQLDAFRENIRRHKGKALAKGKFAPEAKAPEAYLPRSA